MKGREIYAVSCPNLPYICGGGEAVFEGKLAVRAQGLPTEHSELAHPFILRGRPWEEISVQWSSLSKAVPEYLCIEGTDVAPTLLLPQGLLQMCN